MSPFPALHRRPAQRPPAKGAAVRAAVLTSAGTAAIVAGCAYQAMRCQAPHSSAIAVTAAQALLSGWLELTSTHIPAVYVDHHLRLPAAWHHDPLVMAGFHLLVGLALALLFRGTADLPARLSHSAASTARHWWTRLLYVISLVLHRTDEPLPQPRPAPRPTVALPRPQALAALLHRVQPCAP
ncbi:MAG: hypothetical protein H5T76_00930 [Streptomyces sp.]|nr:hypothetical protein [Streptomyces sp.]